MEACIRWKELREDVSQLIRDECHHLSILLEATQVRPSRQIVAAGDCNMGLTAHQKIGEISSRSRDKIISKGEKLSCQLMTAILQDQVGLVGCVVAGVKLTSTSGHDRSIGRSV